jgi:hypothetical protein
MIVDNSGQPPTIHEAIDMIRTIPICNSPSHRHAESLRGIFRRLERELDGAAPRRSSRSAAAATSGTSARRFAF